MTGEAYAAAGARAGSPRGERSTGAPPSPAAPLMLAAGCAAALALVWCLAELVPAVHLRDAIVLDHFTSLSGPGVNPALRTLLHLMDPSLYVLWGIALVALALARSRPRTALAIAVVLALAPLSAEVLKPLLSHGNDGYRGTQLGASSWPSRARHRRAHAGALRRAGAPPALASGDRGERNPVRGRGGSRLADPPQAHAK